MATMANSEALNGQVTANNESVNNGEKIARLELQYIQLLESKIAALTTSTTPDTQNGAQSDINGTKLEAQPEAGKEEDSRKQDESTSKDKEGADGEATSKEGTLKTDESTQTKKDTDSSGKIGTEGAEPVKTSRYNIVISKWDDKELRRRDVPAELAKDEDVDKSDGKGIAFTFKKFPPKYKDSPVLPYSTVEIESKPLLELLNEGIKHVQYNLKETIISPFEFLIWSWDLISEATKPNDQDSDEIKQARTDLQELLKTISSQSGVEKLNTYFSKRETYKKENMITHDALWTIFPLGTVVFSRPVLDQEQLFFVLGHSQDFPESENEEEPFELKCYSYDWDGSSFNRTAFVLKIDYFKDKQNISALSVYPVEYHEDEEGLRRRLVKRGREYYDLCIARPGEQMFKYNGSVICQRESRLFQGSSNVSDDQSDAGSSSSSSRRQEPRRSAIEPSLVRGDVMVDFTSYIRFQPPHSPIMGSLSRRTDSLECSCPECRRNSGYEKMFRFTWDGKVPGSKRPLTDEQLALFPPRVLGYAMRIKRWVQLLVSKTDAPGAASQEIFEKLQLREETKDMIKGLVLAHDQGKADIHGKKKGVTDFVEDKGKGLVIMLYGLPGVGKTLTAEGVAMLARKPLFTIGVSDIGTTSQDIERSLADVFELASTWQAVLLIDEADIFLEARDSSDSSLQRNAMVSVLLRILEYFEGILFLTTNRMRAFDIAVQSRIHLAVKYGDLTPGQRQEIFFHFLQQLEKNDQIGEEWEGKHGIRNWVERNSRKNFNGRQIRNIVSAGICLARSKNEKLTTDHLDDVADATTDFQKDLSDQEAIYRAQQMEKK